MTIDIPIENQLFEEKSDSAIETFPKQVSFPDPNRWKHTLCIFRSLVFRRTAIFQKIFGISIASTFNQKETNLVLLYHQN
jgi:hypothetical protein